MKLTTIGIGLTHSHPFPIKNRSAHFAIRAYQVTLSSLVGRQCRHLPSCSSYTDEAIQRHGLWAGGWMGLSRVSRCRPNGTAGYDPVNLQLPAGIQWYTPWHYGHWRHIPEPNPTPQERAAKINDLDINRHRTSADKPSKADK